MGCPSPAVYNSPPAICLLNGRTIIMQMTSIRINQFKAYFVFTSTAGSIVCSAPLAMKRRDATIGDQIAAEIVVVEEDARQIEFFGAAATSELPLCGSKRCSNA
jgi:hypothetical protein